jgi:hypothetical protein
MLGDGVPQGRLRSAFGFESRFENLIALPGRILPAENR